MHMLSSLDDWNNLKKLGILEVIESKKQSGQIRHIGFSFHGRAEEFVKILTDYNWEFCQIQYNYLDENYQAGIAGLNKAKELGIGVVVMEPLRGGSLANKAPDKAREIFANYKEQFSPAYWALRFVMNTDGVCTVLSGMNESSHILENIEVASKTHINSRTREELSVIEDVKNVYKTLMKVPCTACGYCMPCPMGVDIPGTFSDYNNLYYFKASKLFTKVQYSGKTIGKFGGNKSSADLCINCGKCKKHCPQNIDIPVKLKEAHKHLHNGLLNFVLKHAPLNKKKKS